MTLVSNAARGSSSGSTPQLFTSTLVADTASIDTGAGGIIAGHGTLTVVALLRTDDVGATAAANILVNNDGGANYDREDLAGVAAAASAASSLAQTSWAFTVHGSGGGASYASLIILTIPAYDATTFFKGATALLETVDSTAANARVQATALTWKNTAAITRLAVSATGAAKLKAGSSLTIYGTA